MAALAETRDLGSSLPLPADVRRICCIGDSVTYGQGVAPRQTLAAHIARFANMAYPDQIVWVDNRGQSSGNIWHSWIPFARLAEKVRYDAAIFSLCNNDSQIFESNSVQYSDADDRTWLRDGSVAPLVRRTIADLARTAAEQKLCLLLDFYTFWDKDAPLVEAVGRECRSVGLPFVDLLHFLKEESRLSVAEFAASPFDGHPSDSGHQAAARRIVEELMVHWRPPAMADGTVAERLVAACDHAIRDGWGPDDIFDWALRVLDAKETIERRHRARAGVAAFGDLAGARAAIEQRYRRWYADRSAAVQARLLRDRRGELSNMLEQAYASVRNLDEMAFTAQQIDPSMAAELWALLEAAGYYSSADRLLDLPADLKGRLLGMAEAVTAQQATDQGPLSEAYAAVRRDFEGNVRSLAARLPERLDPESIDVPSKRLWQVAYYLAQSSQVSLKSFAEATAHAASGPPPAPVFLTTVDVRIERSPGRPKRGGVFNLTVEVDYVEPLRARRSDKLWAGADEDAYVYRFEMPLLLLGDVGIGVPTWDATHKCFLDGELRLARVEIANAVPGAPDRPRPFVWQPASDAKPIHWLSLEQLSMAGQKSALPLVPPQPSPTRGVVDKFRRLWRPFSN